MKQLELIKQFVTNEEYNKCPEHVKQSLFHYIEYHIQLGDFLTAVLSNDLFKSFARADDINRYQLFDIVAWIYNYAPNNCHGNKDIVKAWVTINQVNKIKNDVDKA